MYAQLCLVCLMCCYLFSLFQSKILIAFHSLSHELAPVENVSFEQHDLNHSFLSLKSLKVQDKHTHKGLHNHKTLSLIKTLLNSDDSEDPFAKGKTEFEIDKHIITDSLRKDMLFFRSVDPEYGYMIHNVNSLYLMVKGPPPRLITT